MSIICCSKKNSKYRKHRQVGKHRTATNCPDPTQQELRRALAAQGAVMQATGLAMLVSLKGQKKIDGKMRLALKVLAESRNSLEAASKITEEEKGNQS